MTSSPDRRTYFCCRVEKVSAEHEFFEYKDEGHGFMNASEEFHKTMKQAGMPIGKKESQDAGWARVFAFLKKHIG